MTSSNLICRGAPALIVLVYLAICSGCQRGNTYVPPPPPAVTVAQPVEKKVADYIEFTGSTAAMESVQIRARVNGYLESVNFKDGATVNRGDLLFTIEAAPYQAALAGARANVQKAESTLKLAEAEVARATPLVQRGALTQQELDSRLAERESAAADVGAAKAALTQAELNLSYTRVLAPIAGRVGRHMLDIGNLVQAESSMLTTIESYHPIYAYFNLAETDLLRLRERRRKQNLPSIEQQPPVVYLGLANEDDFPHEGHLDFAELGVDATTGTALRRAIFPNDDDVMVPGLFVRIRAPIGEPQPHMLVSERALGADQRGDYVLVVNDQNVVEQRPVRLGITVGTMRVVDSGVKAGEWIVVNGLQRARPGAKVNPERSSEKTDLAHAPEQATAATK